MNSKQYNICVNEFSDRVFRFVVKNLRHEEDARDVVQRSFEKLWIKKATVDFEKAKSFLFTVANNTMIDHIRKVKRMRTLPSTEEETAYAKGHRSFELKDALNQALDAIPEIQKRLVLLRDYEGYSYKEIGEITQLKEAQVKVYLFRARKKLQELIRQQEWATG